MPEFGDKLADAAYSERVGSYGIVINQDSMVALIKLPQGYYLLGGGVGENEDFETALKREVIEEAGFESLVIKNLGSACQYINKTNQNIFQKKTGHFFLITLGERISLVTEKEHELVWHDKDEALLILKHDFQRWGLKKALEFTSELSDRKISRDVEEMFWPQNVERLLLSALVI